MLYQQTLSRSVSLFGVGLHSGEPCTLSLHPAPVNTGIVFFRKTNGHPHTCEASVHHLRTTELCTAIGFNGFHVQTIEHVLSALWGMEIDNVYIEVNASEVPVMDGSAEAFVQLIQSAGILQQKCPRRYLKVLTPIEVQDGKKKVTILPATTSKITYTIDFAHDLIRQQSYEHHWSASAFRNNIAQARTFAFSHEVEALWARGLGKGGSLQNTVVFSEQKVMNEEGLRFPDECVRHKVLDLIGDLALLGIRIIGHIIADRSGHQLHTELVRTILENQDAWTMFSAEQLEAPAYAPSVSPIPVLT